LFVPIILVRELLLNNHNSIELARHVQTKNIHKKEDKEEIRTQAKGSGKKR
jgi:hypothetical protein